MTSTLSRIRKFPAEFEEGKHPRSTGGEFTESGHIEVPKIEGGHHYGSARDAKKGHVVQWTAADGSTRQGRVTQESDKKLPENNLAAQMINVREGTPGAADGPKDRVHFSQLRRVDEGIAPGKPEVKLVQKPDQVLAAPASPARVYAAVDDDSKGFGDNLSKDEVEAVKVYAHAASYPINDLLRHGRFIHYISQDMADTGTTKADIQQVTATLDRVMGKSALPEDAVLYRGGPYAHLKVGQEFTEHGFSSTSASRKTAAEFTQSDDDADEIGENMAIFRITAPKGTRGVPVGGEGLHGDQGEVLLDRNTTYRVTKVVSSGKLPVVHVTIHRQTGSVAKADFEESKHPRANNGQFGMGNSPEAPGYPQSLARHSLAPVTQGDLDAHNKSSEKLLDPSNKKDGSAFTTRWRTAGELSDRLEGNQDWQRLADHLAGVAEPKYQAMLGRSYPGVGQITPEKLAASTMVNEWSRTANKQSPLTVALQLAVHREFGLGNAAVDHFDSALVKAAGDQYGTHMAGLQAFARAQYENTQEYLKKNKTDSMLLYRGMTSNGPIPGINHEGTASTTTDVATQPFSSFTSSLQKASEFAGSGPVGEKFIENRTHAAVAATHVPAERIFSLGQTGMGDFQEREVLVLGGVDPMHTVGWERDKKRLGAANIGKALIAGGAVAKAGYANDDEVRQNGIVLTIPYLTLLASRRMRRRRGRFAPEHSEGDIALQDTVKAADFEESKHRRSTSGEFTESGHIEAPKIKPIASRGRARVAQHEPLSPEATDFRHPEAGVAVHSLFGEHSSDLGGSDRETLSKYDPDVADEVSKSVVNDPRFHDAATRWHAATNAAASNLPDDMELARRATRTVMGGWWSTWGDVWNTQMAVVQEFGTAHGNAAIPLSAKKAAVPEDIAVRQVVLRAIYNHTQAMFARKGVTHVDAYRGMILGNGSKSLGKIGGPGERDVSATMRPASSFSADPEVSKYYAGLPSKMGDEEGIRNKFKRAGTEVPVMVSVKIPASRILSTGMTGFGSIFQREMVVLASGGNVHVHVGKDVGVLSKVADRDFSVDLDEDPDNADWIRILDGNKPESEPDNGANVPDNDETHDIETNAVTKADWEESKHPRGHGGEFGSGGNAAVPKALSAGVGWEHSASGVSYLLHGGKPHGQVSGSESSGFTASTPYDKNAVSPKFDTKEAAQAHVESTFHENNASAGSPGVGQSSSVERKTPEGTNWEHTAYGSSHFLYNGMPYGQINENSDGFRTSSPYDSNPLGRRFDTRGEAQDHIESMFVQHAADRAEAEKKHAEAARAVQVAASQVQTRPAVDWAQEVYGRNVVRPYRAEDGITQRNFDKERMSFKSSISPDEGRALEAYTSTYNPDSGYQVVNSALRSGATMTSDQKKVSDGLDSMLDRSTVGKDTVVYRGVEAHHLSDFHQPGAEFQDKGYSSTSVSKEQAQRFGVSVMRITIPAGFKAAPTGGDSEEQEVLLPRGTKFRVNRVEEHPWSWQERHGDILHVTVTK